MLAPSFASTIDGLITHVERHGVDASSTELAILGRHGRQHGVVADVVDLLTDESAPAILRERAAAYVSAELRVVPPNTAVFAA